VVEKKVDPVPVPVIRFSAAKSKEAVSRSRVVSRSRSGYAWSSQQSRERRSEALDFANSHF
jgi:hypothetical protein